MPRIEPIPTADLPESSRVVIEGGVEDGLYATPVPLQVFAYHSEQLGQLHRARLERGKGSLLGGRILELIRIRSAQLGTCQPCMQSRKHDSITDRDVACLLDPNHPELSEPERLALEFLDLLSADHHAIDEAFYRRLAAVFSAAQIVELGFSCAETMGVHRFIHTLDLFGEEAPVVPFSPEQVDAPSDATRGLVGS